MYAYACTHLGTSTMYYAQYSYPVSENPLPTISPTQKSAYASAPNTNPVTAYGTNVSVDSSYWSCTKIAPSLTSCTLILLMFCIFVLTTLASALTEDTNLGTLIWFSYKLVRLSHSSKVRRSTYCAR